MKESEIKDLLELVGQLQTLGQQIEARLAAALHPGASDLPVMSTKDFDRVGRFGEVAHRHLALVESKGTISLGESLALRREMFGEKVQATANLFGIKGSGALFYRQTPYGKPRHDSDPVCLTEEGKRIAGLWRELHPSTTS